MPTREQTTSPSAATSGPTNSVIVPSDTTLLSHKLIQAASKGDIASVEKLLKNGGANVINKRSEHGGVTALHNACFWGRTHAVEILLNAGADIEMTDESGDTPLHNACINGHPDIVAILLGKGAIFSCNNFDETPLHNACSRGNADIVEIFLKKLQTTGASVDSTDDNGTTPLHNACMEGHVDIVEMLLKAGANVNAANHAGYTPLRLACEGSHVNIVKMLLKAGADVHVTDKPYKQTPLQKTADKLNNYYFADEKKPPYREIANLLLIKGATVGKEKLPNELLVKWATFENHCKANPDTAEASALQRARETTQCLNLTVKASRAFANSSNTLSEKGIRCSEEFRLFGSKAVDKKASSEITDDKATDSLGACLNVLNTWEPPSETYSPSVTS